MFPKAYVCSAGQQQDSLHRFRTRLRDAIRGKITFDYPSEISTPQLANWYSQIVIKYTKEHVYIGPSRGRAKRVKGSWVTKELCRICLPRTLVRRGRCPFQTPNLQREVGRPSHGHPST